MMISTQKRLHRRTLLRGLGAAIALPMLDSMVPAFASTNDPMKKPVKRFGSIYIPHGAVMERWTPEKDGALELSPILKPLEEFKRQLLVLSHLDNAPALIREGEPLGGHANISGAFLTGVHAKPASGANVQAGVSVDQIAAAHLGADTQLGSLEVGLEDTDHSGSCDVGFSCAYTNSMSWSTPTTPLPVENNPRAVFERLFGDSATTDAKSRLAQIKRSASILDSVTEKVSSLQRKLGSGDRTKLTQYLEAVRDAERRIQKAEQQADRELPVIERPSGAIPPTFEQHCKLMMDLQTLAYQTDMTRVSTFMMSKELSNRTYPEIAVPDPHHPLSHHQEKKEKKEKLQRLQTYHMTMFAYYLDKLRSIPDGDGTLLDNMMIVYGSGMGNSHQHEPRNLPILVAGGGSGTLHGGRHLRYERGTPLTNMYLTLLNKLGVPVESMGDSTGQMQELSGV